MKIALVGFGNMGQEIARIIEENKKHTIISISYSVQQQKLDGEGIKKADVVIEFTSADIVLENIEKIAKLKKPLVVGTTGWYEKINYVKDITKKNNIGFVYGQNFSIGANIFFKTLEFSSKLFSKFGNYDVYGFEMHHAGKKDSPSGTAKKVSQIILDNFPAKKNVQTEKINRQIKKDELHFASIRGGRNAGKHEIIFDSRADEIILSHQAHNRRGFAEGALFAAEFIQDKKGFYSFDEVFRNI